MNKKRNLSCLMDEKLYKDFSLYCFENDISKQELVIKWIANFLAEKVKENK